MGNGWHRQSSFAGGELSPSMHGRDDLTVYQAGLASGRNGRITPAGEFESRPGMLDLKNLGSVTSFDPESGGYTLPGMLKFVYSETDALMLIFTNAGATGTVWIFKNRTYLGQFAHPFTGVSFSQLRYVQSGNYVFINHANAQPQVLQRITDTSWTWTPMTLAIPDFVNDFQSEPLALIDEPLPHDAALDKQWDLYATMLLYKLDGSGYDETTPQKIGNSIDPTALPSLSLHTYDRTISIGPKAGSPAIFEMDFLYDAYHLWSNAQKAKWSIYAFNFYAGRGSGPEAVIGKVGQILSDNRKGWSKNQFKWFGDRPDYDQPPPQGFNPLERFAADGSLDDIEFPIACCFFEQRLVQAGTIPRPFTFWLSAAGSFLNFDQPHPAPAESSLEFTLAVREWEEIRAVVGLQKLLIFTTNGVHSLTGANGALSAQDLSATHLETDIGTNWLVPQVNANSVVYISTRPNGVRALNYDSVHEAYLSRDLSFFARHLFDGFGLVSWCHQRCPASYHHIVRGEGSWITLTYNEEQQLLAWTHNDTDGIVRTMETLPAGEEDDVYACVLRNKGGAYQLHVEVFASRDIPNATQSICLDQALVYDGTLSTVTHSGTTGALTANCDGFTVRNLVPDVSGNVALPATFSHVVIGRPYVSEIGLLDAGGRLDRGKAYNCTRVEVEYKNSRGLYASEKQTPDDDHPEFQLTQDPSGGEGIPIPLQTDSARIGIASTWNKGGRIWVRTRDPQPMTIVAVSRDLAEGAD